MRKWVSVHAFLLSPSFVGVFCVCVFNLKILPHGCVGISLLIPQSLVCVRLHVCSLRPKFMHGFRDFVRVCYPSLLIRNKSGTDKGLRKYPNCYGEEFL